MYAIQNKACPELFWANNIGWIEGPGETRFTADERKALSLPMGGQWVRIR